MSSALALAFLFPYPLPYPLFSTNPENPSRVVPTSTIAHEEEIPRKEEQKESKSKMSIFASQPFSMFGAPSHYITTKKQVKTPSYKSKPDSAISLPASTRSGSASIVSELSPKPQPVYSVRQSRSSSISSTSSVSTTISKDLEAPSYAPIKTPSPLALNHTGHPRPGTGISSSQPKKNAPPAYTASVSSSPTPVEKKKATWRTLWIASEDAHDEEFEMRMRAEREDRARGEGEEKEKVPGEWCWGCLWVGPHEQPWVAHYIF